jgi:hypothetical protein
MTIIKLLKSLFAPNRATKTSITIATAAIILGCIISGCHGNNQQQQQNIKDITYARYELVTN